MYVITRELSYTANLTNSVVELESAARLCATTISTSYSL
jgi:hypothetical protein